MKLSHGLVLPLRLLEPSLGCRGGRILFSRLEGFLPGCASLLLLLSEYERGTGGSLALSGSGSGLRGSGGAERSVGIGGPAAVAGGVEGLALTGSLDRPGDEDEDASGKADRRTASL